jgi:outer membrane protein
MKKFLTVLTLLFLVFGYSNATNVAYVDMEKVMNQSVKGKKYKAELDAKLKYYQNKAKELQNKITSLQRQLNSSALNQKAKEEKMKELREAARQLQNLEIQANEELAKMKAEAEKKMVGDIKAIAQKIAKNKNLDLILYGGLISGVLYADKKLDITDEVLKEYNK